MTNQYNNVLYIGVTSALYQRVWQHKNKVYSKSFTSIYDCTKLAYYKFFPTINEAIAEEKRLKAGSREQKKLLVNSFNPNWIDLFETLEVD